MKNNIDKLTPKGNNIYEDSKKRLFIGDYKNKKAYLVPKEDMSKYSLFQYRYFIVIISFVAIGNFADWLIAAIVALALYIVLEIVYRNMFLKNLQCYEDVDFPKKSTVVDRLLEKEKTSNYLRLAGIVALQVLLVLNLLNEVESFSNIMSAPNDLILLIVSIIILVYSLYMFATTVIAIKKSK